MYGVEPHEPMDMMRQAMATEQDFSIRFDAEHSLAYAAMAMKNCLCRGVRFSRHVGHFLMYCFNSLAPL